MTDLIGQILLLLGAGIFFLAGIGLFRFNDPYSRISAVATASGVGIALVTAGVLFINPEPANIIKGVIAIFLQLLTASIASIVIARSTLNSGYPFSDETDTSEVDGPL